MNVADSEVVASVMQMAGYEMCQDEAEADAIFMNTCSVRENAENKIYNRLDTLHAEQKKGRKVILGVLGCMAERVKDDLIENHHAQLVAGPDSYLNLPDMIAQAEAGNKAIDIALSKTETYKATTALCLILVAASVRAMWIAYSTRCETCNNRAIKRLRSWDKTSTATDLLTPKGKPLISLSYLDWWQKRLPQCAFASLLLTPKT